MHSVAYNTLQSCTHWHIYWRFHPGMLDMVCERCPAVWLVTKTISVLALRQRDKQDVKEMNSHHTVLNSTKGHKPHLTLAYAFLKLSCLWATSLQLLKGHTRPMNTCANLSNRMWLHKILVLSSTYGNVQDFYIYIQERFV